jgi:hypothetical protein
MAKSSEKLCSRDLRPILEENLILPDHQLGFLQTDCAIEHVHGITEIIRGDLEKRQYCSAAFPDITQVWHPGLLFKIKKFLPHGYCRIL